MINQAGSSQHTQTLVAGGITQHLLKVLSTTDNVEVQTQVIMKIFYIYTLNV